MAGHKRKSIALDDPSSDADLPALTPAITKRSKTSSTLPLNLSGSELAALPSEELIGRVLELQETLRKIQAQLDNEKIKVKNSQKTGGETLRKIQAQLDNKKTKVKNLQKTGGQTTLTPIAGNGAAQEWSAEKVAERAKELADETAQAIWKQMRWQPSGKSGTTKWSHTGVAPNAQVFFTMLNLPLDGKAWKQKKISLHEFENVFGDIVASIRYGTLRISGEYVNVKWAAEENSFTLSGVFDL